MATQTYSPIANVASDNLFDPTQANNFFGNPNDASVLYSADLTQDQQRFNDLVSAYQFLQDPNNQSTLDQQNYAGYSQYLLGQLQNDLTEQQNLVSVAQGQNNVNTNATTSNYVGSMLNAIASGNGGNYGQINTGQMKDLASWLQQNPQLNQTVNIKTNYGNFNQTLSNLINFVAGGGQGINMNDISNAMNNNGITTQALGLIQTNLANAQKNLGPLQNAATQGFTLNAPDYAHAQQQLQNYYGIDANGNPIAGDNGQVQQATQQANNDIYQTAFNLKNQINGAANRYGVASSGERKQALGTVNDQATKQAAQAFSNAANSALKNIGQYNQQVQQEQAQQNALTNDVKGSNLASLFGNSTQNAINAYNTQTGTQNQNNLQNAQNQIQQQSANTDFLNSLFSGGGQAIGQLAGTAIGGLI